MRATVHCVLLQHLMETFSKLKHTLDTVELLEMILGKTDTLCYIRSVCVT